ncbi:uncharacterized protein LOC143251727 [Tachypleus tridentatus]|uniref:uncharacterized protein LOC143251727 n=1 Tax=Tachypleus tridentatus TaxID=6853 RepID=UPI003FD269A9
MVQQMKTPQVLIVYTNTSTPITSVAYSPKAYNMKDCPFQIFALNLLLTLTVGEYSFQHDHFTKLVFQHTPRLIQYENDNAGLKQESDARPPLEIRTQSSQSRPRSDSLSHPTLLHIQEAGSLGLSQLKYFSKPFHLKEIDQIMNSYYGNNRRNRDHQHFSRPRIRSLTEQVSNSKPQLVQRPQQLNNLKLPFRDDSASQPAPSPGQLQQAFSIPLSSTISQRLHQNQHRPPVFKKISVDSSTDSAVLPRAVSPNIRNPQYENEFVPIYNHKTTALTVETLVSASSHSQDSSNRSNENKLKHMTPSAIHSISSEAGKLESNLVDVNCRGGKDLGWCDLAKHYPRQV